MSTLPCVYSQLQRRIGHDTRQHNRRVVNEPCGGEEPGTNQDDGVDNV